MSNKEQLFFIVIDIFKLTIPLIIPIIFIVFYREDIVKKNRFVLLSILICSFLYLVLFFAPKPGSFIDTSTKNFFSLFLSIILSVISCYCAKEYLIEYSNNFPFLKRKSNNTEIKYDILSFIMFAISWIPVLVQTVYKMHAGDLGTDLAFGLLVIIWIVFFNIVGFFLGLASKPSELKYISIFLNLFSMPILSYLAELMSLFKSLYRGVI